MGSILGIGIAWTIWGVAELLGIVRVPKKYRGRSWTKDYIRSSAMTQLMLGVPFLSLYLLESFVAISLPIMVLLIVLFGSPAFVYSIHNEQKYDALLADGVE